MIAEYLFSPAVSTAETRDDLDANSKEPVRGLLSDAELLAKLEAYTDEMKNDVIKKDEKLQAEGYQAFLKK